MPAVQVLHVELRQFPHVARAFNLTPEEVQARILARWAAGQEIELEDRRWQPGRAKLTIYEARTLAGDEIGMGRGWGTVSREGEDVTERLLAAARRPDPPASGLAEVKERLLVGVGDQTLPLSHAVELAAAPGRRPSERLALAEQAVWELLHEQRLQLIDAGSVVAPERWQPVLLSWDSWAAGGVAVRVA